MINNEYAIVFNEYQLKYLHFILALNPGNPSGFEKETFIEPLKNMVQGGLTELKNIKLPPKNIHVPAERISWILHKRQRTWATPN